MALAKLVKTRGSPGASFGPIKPAPKRKAPQLVVPAGMYDPSLDYSLGAAKRGLGDLSADTTLGNARLQDDYNLGLQQNTEDTGYQQGQLDTGHNRTLADIALARGRAGEDYGNATQALTRRYGILAGQQGEAMNAAGLGEGGAAAQAAAKRKTNQAIDQAPIDLGYNRTLADMGTQEQRSNEDYGTQTARLNTLSSRTAGQLGLNYQRQTTDANTGLARARRENTYYGQGIQQQKIFQATQAGWTPPAPPRKKRRR